MSGIAFGPNFASAALASALVRPRDDLFSSPTAEGGAKTDELEAAGIVSLAFGSRFAVKYYSSRSKNTELST
jgi:hypothetical protein